MSDRTEFDGLQKRLGSGMPTRGDLQELVDKASSPTALAMSEKTARLILSDEELKNSCFNGLPVVEEL